MILNLGNLPRTIWVEKSGGASVAGFVDQRRLPGELVLVRTADWREMVDAVKTLAVRGAPAIGVAGAAAVMLAAFEYAERPDFDDRLEKAARVIAEARPTAVNLSWGVRRAQEAAREASTAGKTAAETAEALYELAEALIAEDEAVNRRIGAHGTALLRALAETGAVGRPLNILTHCNAGSLATAFYGTALGVVYAAAQEGLVNRVFADETRPVNQGARLTVWELARAGVPVTLQCDDMAPSLMAEGQVDAVIVGADRIAANGDAANKVGTLGLAIMARHFQIPFYVAAPKSTIDCTTKSGSAIPIEERDPAEVLAEPIPGVAVRNPAFDVTPYDLITAIITEDGIWKPLKP
ncbi:S-methyl-5-thioribose-1-phosphate isomerase [uncultured Adlercreutzia sp.]|uniref:S-methyl-5-thioribose-1-phosphate isomerase n=1 Tax=uncultured Adlercreutzia sp. TaxID=875803 RepID=UPI0025903AAF|nr:S-methyl-5-thioribose-1-phosphate isomerase [uncultured Adlercreutzia sp.]